MKTFAWVTALLVMAMACADAADTPQTGVKMRDRLEMPAAADANLIRFPPVETHLLPSKHVKQTFKIQVMQPGRKKGDSRRFPVVYATDGNWSFDMFKSIAYLIQGGDAPPFILVGIGYPGDSPMAGASLRARDFTYPPYPQWGSMLPPRAEGTLTAEPGTKNFYGGEDFRRFIADELVPFIDGKYATLPGDRTYFGHSGGGYFGLFTLFTQPDLFKNYIVSSPGVIYHGDAPGGVKYDNNEFGLQMVRDFAASRKTLRGVKLYLSAGGEEEFEPGLKAWRLTSSLLRLSQVFQEAAIAGLEVTTEIIPAETHMSVWPIAFTHGVQVVYGTRHIPRPVSQAR